MLTNLMIFLWITEPILKLQTLYEIFFVSFWWNIESCDEGMGIHDGETWMHYKFLALYASFLIR
jgi:hypothetical protein